VAGTCDYLLMNPGSSERHSSAASTVARPQPSDLVCLTSRGSQSRSAWEPVGANRVGAIIGAIGAAIGICVGTAAAVIALTPSSAVWMSGIMCITGYRLAYGDEGQSASFHCVNGDSSYDVKDLAVLLQSVLAVLVLCVGLIGLGLIRSRLRRA
jgi:hypothetical protein